MFPATNFRLKRLKKSPLPFQHHKAILQLDHNTSPKSSSTTTTTKPPPPNSEITPTQSTSTNTPSTFTVATTTTNNTATTTTSHTASTSYANTTTNTTTTTNTSTQTDTDIPIPILMQLNIAIPSRICTPSTSITIPLSSSITPSPIFPCTLQDLQRLALWGLPYHLNNNQRRSPSPGIFEDTPHPRNAQRCTLNTCNKIYF